MPVLLSELTTLRLGGPAGRVVTAGSADEIVDVVAAADAAGEPVLVLGGGSNLVAADDGWPGLVVLLRSDGIERVGDRVVVQSGVVWDELVARTVAENWSGLAPMSGVPGLAGATPVQNVGAYGREVADCIAGIRVYDRTERAVQDWSPQRCGFGFRTSALKQTDRYVVLSVTFELPASPLAPPVRYAEVARRLGIEQGDVAPSADVRAAVLELRAGKGMLLDPDDHDTWSVGSFFVNPIVAADAVPEGCPHFVADDQLKLSAAWLIEQAGYAKGYARGRVGISTKHSLALTNRGGATTAQLLELAREIRDGVERRFGIRLRPEPRLVGVTL